MLRSANPSKAFGAFSCCTAVMLCKQDLNLPIHDISRDFPEEVSLLVACSGGARLPHHVHAAAAHQRN